LVDQVGFGFYFNIAISVIFMFILLRFYPKMDPNL